MSDETDMKASEGVKAAEEYKLARAQIEHENILIGQRTTWYLTFQGFLFTALFVAIGLFDPGKGFSPSAKQHLVLGVLLIGVLGITSSFACYGLISAAYRQIAAVKFWSKKQKWPENQFPRLTGDGSSKILGFAVNGAHFLLLVAFIWVAALLVFISAVFRSYCGA